MFNKAHPAGAASSKDARAHVGDQSRRYRVLELSTDTAHLQDSATGIRFSIISEYLCVAPFWDFVMHSLFESTQQMVHRQALQVHF